MGLTENIIYGIVGVTGVSAAVGVPLGMKNVGIGRNYKLNTISLTTCDHNKKENMSEISYGSSDSKQVCWEYSDDQKGESNSQSSEFTELFADSGLGKGSSGWGRENRGGTGQCIKDQDGRLNVQSQGSINVETKDNSGKEDYAGLCSNTSGENTKFVKKKKEAVTSGKEATGTLGTCNSNCFESTRESGGVKELTKEKEEGGKQVKFYGDSKPIETSSS